MSKITKIDRELFYHKLRHKALLGHTLAQSQVDCLNAVLNALEDHGVDNKWHAAHCLATPVLEVGTAYFPVREGFKRTDAESREYVKRQGYKYAQEVNGQVYYGRGLVQLTWERNYRFWGDLMSKPLVLQPDRVLEPATAAYILVRGSLQGAFTGHAVKDYGDDADGRWFDSRAVVNGDKNRLRGSKKIGTVFADLVKEFADCVEFMEDQDEKSLTQPINAIAPSASGTDNDDQTNQTGPTMDLNIFSSDSKLASGIRTALQMGGALAVGYGYASAADVTGLVTNVNSIFGGLAALVGIFGFFTAKFGKK